MAHSPVIVMVRPSTVLWVLVPFAYLVLARLESWRRVLLLGGMALLGFCLVFAPWWVRNARLTGIFIPLRSSAVRSASGVLESLGGESPRSLTPAEKVQAAVKVSTTPWSAVYDVLWEDAFDYDQTRVDFGSYPVSFGPEIESLLYLMRDYHTVLLALAFLGLLFVRRSPRLLIDA